MRDGLILSAVCPVLSDHAGPSAWSCMRGLSPKSRPAGSVAARETNPEMPQGAVVPGEIAEGIWLVLRAYFARHRANGGRVHPAAATFLDDLRAAALAQVIPPSGPDTAPVADIGASSGQVSTDRLAGLLAVTDRHARRLMTKAGHRQVRRGMWRAVDAAAVVAARRRNAA